MKIEFFNTFDGVLEEYPIAPIREALPKWVSVARTDYVAKKKSRTNHIFRCSGIADLYKIGYTVRAWHDLRVEANDDSVRWMVPNESAIGKIAVTSHTADAAAKFIPKRPWSSKTILKLNTPWNVISPVKLLVLPISYPDAYEFEACPGVLDSSISTEVNIQLYVNNINKNFVIEAGTPLCHIIPIYDGDVKMSQRNATEHDKKWLAKKFYITNSTFNYNIMRVKRAFTNHFFK
jgi:hypothetical protein